MALWLVVSVLWSIASAEEIELQECEPPDLPVWGGYGPQQTYYIPGDFIHYYCDVETFIGGNYYRKCLDTGDWSGDTPVCDAPSPFRSTSQSSDMNEFSTSLFATDGIRSTCSQTAGSSKDEWFGNFTQPGQLIRVMLFLPKGPVSYQLVLVKGNGEEVVCVSQTTNIEQYDWTIHNCPEPHNTGATGLKIKSLSEAPLTICEIAAYVLTSPKCTDPHIHIESGRLQINRKTATLACNRGYTRSPDVKLDCIREGQWSRKKLYCRERQWELDEREGTKENGRGLDSEPNRAERLEV